MPDISATTVPEKKPANPVSWNPAIAISVTISIYLVSQFFAAVVMLSIGRSRGLEKDALQNWLTTIGPQFFYVLLIEASSLGLLWLVLRRFKANFKTLGLTRPHLKDLGYTLLGIAIYLPLLIGAMAAIKAWVPSINLNQPQQIGFSGAHGGELWLVFVSLVVLPPIAEEILARGFLYLGLKTTFRVIWAAVITSVMFAAAHLEFGSGAPLLWSAAVDTFILSMVLIWLRERTGRLWASMGLHMAKNFIAFLALFIFIS